jgi:hypothetical protein
MSRLIVVGIAVALLVLLVAAPTALAEPYCDAAKEFVQTTEPRCPKGYTNIGIVRIIRKGLIQKRCQSNGCHAVRPETVPKG